MITAVDSNILMYVLAAHPEYGLRSLDALRESRARGRLIASDVVWAEVSAGFGMSDEANEALTGLGVEFIALNSASALLAGERWAEYRRMGGLRTRVVADFLIGAHALHHAEALLTHDRGFFRSYFPDLTLVDPTHVERTPDRSPS